MSEPQYTPYQAASPESVARQISHIRKVAETGNPYELCLTRYAAQVMLGRIDDLENKLDAHKTEAAMKWLTGYPSDSGIEFVCTEHKKVFTRIVYVAYSLSYVEIQDVIDHYIEHRKEYHG